MGSIRNAIGILRNKHMMPEPHDMHLSQMLAEGGLGLLAVGIIH